MVAVLVGGRRRVVLGAPCGGHDGGGPFIASREVQPLGGGGLGFGGGLGLERLGICLGLALGLCLGLGGLGLSASRGLSLGLDARIGSARSSATATPRPTRSRRARRRCWRSSPSALGSSPLRSGGSGACSASDASAGRVGLGEQPLEEPVRVRLEGGDGRLDLVRRAPRRRRAWRWLSSIASARRSSIRCSVSARIARHLDLRPLADAGDVLVDALPERGGLVGRLGPDGLDPRGSLGLEAGRRLGAAGERGLAHGLDQARDERVLARRRGALAAARRPAARVGAGVPALPRPRSSGSADRPWATPRRRLRVGCGPAWHRCRSSRPRHCLRAHRTRPARRPSSWLARPRRDGRVPRRGRRPPRPGGVERPLVERSQRRTPHRRRARRPMGGENHVSADLTSLDDSSGRDGPAHSGAGRRGWSWCSRVWGSALVVPAGSARRYRVGATPVRRERVCASRRYPCPRCSSRGQPRRSTDGPASSTGSAGRCATSGSRSRTGATSAARTACRRRSSGATTSSCPATRSCATRRSTGWRGCSSSLGVRKLRITGGEPTVRRGLPDLVAMLAELRTPDGEPVDLALTTNGSALRALARPLADAGLRRITVSLDSLDDEMFRRMNGVDFPVDEGARRHRRGGRGRARRRSRSTSSCERGENEDAIVPLARWARDAGPRPPVHRVHGRRDDERLAARRRRAGARRSSRPISREWPLEPATAGLSRRGRRALAVPRRARRDRRHRLGDAAVLRRLHAGPPLGRGQAVHVPVQRRRARPPRAAPERAHPTPSWRSGSPRSGRGRDDRYSERRAAATEHLPEDRDVRPRRLSGSRGPRRCVRLRRVVHELSTAVRNWWTVRRAARAETRG